LISSVCAHSAFGLLCQGEKEKQLDDAIRESRALANAFNASAKTVQISVYVLKGRIAQTDQEAARAIASEMKSLVEEMKAGIGAADVEAVREAASKAKKIGRMLDGDAAKRVSAAVEEARAAAKTIAKTLVDTKSAEAALEEVAKFKLTALESARFAFLDLDG